MKRVACLVVLLLTSMAVAQKVDVATPTTDSDAASQAKREDIRRLLKLTGAGELGKQVATQLITQFRQSQPNVPAKFWDEFAKEIKADELVELSVSAYDNHLTHDDIKQLIEFYESPIGQKLVRVQPQIMQESMMAGQQWGQAMGRRLVERMAEEGFSPQQ